eukprot:COSAG02_NODE_155_length_33066_cov_32.167562_8_plen_100_part_00
MAPSSRAKRRKSVPSAMEKALDKEAARQEKKNKRKRGGKKRSLDGADVEAAHERAEQARAVHDMASRAATASQLDRAAGHLERYRAEAQARDDVSISLM